MGAIGSDGLYWLEGKEGGPPREGAGHSAAEKDG